MGEISSSISFYLISISTECIDCNILSIVIGVIQVSVEYIYTYTVCMYKILFDLLVSAHFTHFTSFVSPTLLATHNLAK